MVASAGLATVSANAAGRGRLAASSCLDSASPDAVVGMLFVPYLRGEVVRETLSIMRQYLLVLPPANPVALCPA
jgi:hypothetical protein